MKRYHDFFSVANWRKVTISERKKHQALNCTQCPTIEEYRLKMSNHKLYDNNNAVASPQTPSLHCKDKLVASTPTDTHIQNKPFTAIGLATSQTPSRDYRSQLVFNTPTDQPTPQSMSMISHNTSSVNNNTDSSIHRSQNSTRRRINLEDISETVKDNLYKRMPKSKVPRHIVRQIIRDHMTIENIPIALKKQIISEAQSEQQAAERKDELKSIFTTNASFRAHDKRRLTSHTKYVKNKEKKHTGPLHRYSFDKDIVKRTLRRVAGNSMDLGDKMYRKWFALGKEAGVKKKFGPQPSSLNVAQVSNMFLLTLISVCKSTY